MDANEEDDVVMLINEANEVVLQATRRAVHVTSNAMAASVKNYGQQSKLPAISVASSSEESDLSDQEQPLEHADQTQEAADNNMIRDLQMQDLVNESREGGVSSEGGLEDDGSCASISYPPSEQEDDCSEEDASDSEMEDDSGDEDENDDDDDADDDVSSSDKSIEEESSVNASIQRQGSITDLRLKSQIHQATCSGTKKSGDSESPNDREEVLDHDLSMLLEDAKQWDAHGVKDGEILEKQRNKKRKFAELTKWAATGCIVAAGVAAAYLATQQYDTTALVRSVVSDFTR